MTRLTNNAPQKSAFRPSKSLLAVAFGFCAFLAAIGPFRDHQQGALAQKQSLLDQEITRKIVSLKNLDNGYLGLSPVDLDKLSLPSKTTWDAHTIIDILPYGMGFFIEHAFSSYDTCTAYLPVVAKEGFDQVFVDNRLIFSKTEAQMNIKDACSNNQNIIRLVRLDPGQQQKLIAYKLAEARKNQDLRKQRSSNIETEKNPNIPGGYFVPEARQATTEELKAAEAPSKK